MRDVPLEKWQSKKEKGGHVEIYAEFSEDTALHGDTLRSFLWEAIKAKRDKRF